MPAEKIKKLRWFQPNGAEITDCRIVLSYIYRNHLDELRQGEDDFLSIWVFKNYLQWHPTRAMAIGYQEIDQEVFANTQSTNVRLSIRYNENGGTRVIHFENAEGFGYFLKDNSALARCLGIP
jgi:hypothetical protein